MMSPTSFGAHHSTPDREGVGEDAQPFRVLPTVPGLAGHRLGSGP